MRWFCRIFELIVCWITRVYVIVLVRLFLTDAFRIQFSLNPLEKWLNRIESRGGRWGFYGELLEDAPFAQYFHLLIRRKLSLRSLLKFRVYLLFIHFLFAAERTAGTHRFNVLTSIEYFLVGAVSTFSGLIVGLAYNIFDSYGNLPHIPAFSVSMGFSIPFHMVPASPSETAGMFDLTSAFPRLMSYTGYTTRVTPQIRPSSRMGTDEYSELVAIAVDRVTMFSWAEVALSDDALYALGF